MPAYSLTFRQSYYAYRDNHEAKNQTTIGLVALLCSWSHPLRTSCDQNLLGSLWQDDLI
jgi:hypothetical protein